MKNYTLKAEVFAKTFAGHLFVGADVDKKGISVAVVHRQPGGKLECGERRRMAPTREAVEAFAKRYPGAHWFYEAGPTGYSLLYWLKGLGQPAQMVAPSLIPVSNGDRVKTNARDALKLATLAAGGQLTGVIELTQQEYADRSVVRGRRQAVEARSDIARQLKSELLFHGITFEQILDCAAGEEVSSDISKKFLKALREVKGVPQSLKVRLALDADRYESAHAAVLKYDKALRDMAAEERFVKQRNVLESIPMVGIITSMEIITERGHDRFRSGGSFAHYTGLTPSESSTGDHVRRGHITKAGNPRLRTTFVECAWRLIRVDGWAKSIFDKVRKQHGNSDGSSKKAIVAVARHLAVRTHAMLRDGTTWKEAKATTKKAA